MKNRRLKPHRKLSPHGATSFFSGNQKFCVKIKPNTQTAHRATKNHLCAVFRAKLPIVPCKNRPPVSFRQTSGVTVTAKDTPHS